MPKTSSNNAVVSTHAATAGVIGDRAQRVIGDAVPFVAPPVRPLTVTSVFGPAIGTLVHPQPIQGQVSISYHYGMLRPELAQAFAEDLHYHNQRRVTNTDIKAYAKMLEAGNFIPSTTLYVGCVQGREYLLDGQTRVLAVVMANLPMWCTVVRIGFDTLENMGKFGFALDNGRVRTFAAHSDFSGLSDPSFSNHQKRMARSIQCVWNNRFMGYSNRFPDGRPDELQLVLNVQRFTPVLKEWFGLLKEAKKPEYRGTLERLRKAAVLNAFFVLALEANPEKAKEFFRGLICHEGLGNPNHPCVHLSRFLNEWKVDEVLPYNMAVHTFRAWNAFIAGNTSYRYDKREVDQLLRAGNRHFGPNEIPWPVGLTVEKPCSEYDITTGEWKCRDAK